MINPTHHLKKFVKYSGDDKPADFHVTEERGWLGSGITDCNGVEIFEGDIVKEIFPPDCANYDGRQLVIFRRGKFLLVRECYWARLETCGATPLSWAGSNGIEVVGHIAEETS